MSNTHVGVSHTGAGMTNTHVGVSNTGVGVANTHVGVSDTDEGVRGTGSGATRRKEAGAPRVAATTCERGRDCSTKRNADG